MTEKFSTIRKYRAIHGKTATDGKRLKTTLGRRDARVVVGTLENGSGKEGLRHLEDILTSLAARAHHDISSHRRVGLPRAHHRIGARQAGYRAHARLSVDQQTDVVALLRSLVIGLSAFLRDPDHWRQLETITLAQLRELQALNKELEGSKAELQALGEKLTLVNSELQDKIEDLEATNKDLNQLLNGASLATLYLDRQLRVRRFTPGITRLFRLIPDDIGRELADIALRFQSGDLLAQARGVLSNGEPVKTTLTVEDGGSFLCHFLPFRVRDSRAEGVVLTFADISDLTHIEAELRDSEERFRSYMDNSPAISWMKDEEGRHVYLSRTYEQRFGVDLNDWLGKTDAELWPPHIAENFRKNDLAVLNSGQTMEVVEETSEADGTHAYWRVFKFLVRDSKGNRYVGGIGVDITGQMQVESDLRSSLDRVEESRKDIEYLATHDELTGLPNRALFNDRLETALAQRKRAEDLLSLMFIDLDNFKLINDTLGHDVGDNLLREAAKRLLACVREGDTAARIGGDEFAVLMEHSDKFQAARIAQRILDSVAKPYLLAGKELSVTTSIGIALAPDDGQDSQSVLKSADAAMYQVKGSGKSNFQFFTKATAEAAHKKMELLVELRRALTNKELFLVYQPEIRLGTGELVGVEALIRWKHPSGVVLSPDQFIGLAEESMLVLPMGEMVLDLACRQLSRWYKQGLSIPRVSVNLSSRHFVHGSLQESIPRILTKYGLIGNSLGLGIEITEYALLASGNQVEGRQLLSDLKSHGVQISIDDFGTGYSSLSYLKHYPIDELKIDRSFIEGIARDPGDTAITTAILAMAKALGLPCVAEGVETEEQMAILLAQGCDMAQGYLIGRPMTSRQLAAWTRRRSPPVQSLHS